MRRVVFILDGSAAMNTTEDWQPSRLLALADPVSMAAAACGGDSHPLTQVTVIVARDGVAHRACRANRPEVISEAVMSKWAQVKGRGTFSLENSLRIMQLDVLPSAGLSSRIFGKERNKRGRPGEESSSVPQTKASQPVDVLLLCGSVTTIDAGDVIAGIHDIAGLGFRVNVLSIGSMPEILRQLATETGGELMCPTSLKQALEFLHYFASVIVTRTHHRQSMADSSLAPAVEPVAVVEVLSNTPAGTDHPHQQVRCPICGFVRKGLPSTCTLCSTLLMSRSDAVCASLDGNQHDFLQKIQQNDLKDAGQNHHSLLSCGCCSKQLPLVNTATEALMGNRCRFCRAYFCQQCSQVIETEIKICVCCGRV